METEELAPGEGGVPQADTVEEEGEKDSVDQVPPHFDLFSFRFFSELIDSRERFFACSVSWPPMRITKLVDLFACPRINLAF